MSDLQALKKKQQETWSAGDFSIVAWNTVYAGELLCEEVDLKAGHKVLDVATGSGNTAISAAHRFAKVTGFDYVPALIEKAKERAKVEQLPITFKVGDAENIDESDASFDIVLSTFGCMFAPNQEKTAQEMWRVCKTGGQIGVAAWPPDSFWGQMFGLRGKYLPMPADVKPPVLWGTEDRVSELFPGAEIKFVRKKLTFRFESNDHYLAFFKANFGPMIKAYEELDEKKQKTFTGEIVALLDKHNLEKDDKLTFTSDFLISVISK